MALRAANFRTARPLGYLAQPPRHTPRSVAALRGRARALADAFNKGAIAQTGEFLYLQGNPFSDDAKEQVAKACRGKIRVHLGWPPPHGGLEPEEWDR